MGNLKIWWAFGVSLVGFSSVLWQSSALKFGVCEVSVPKLVTTNLSTAYWIDKKIQGCCKGFIKVQDRCEPDCRNIDCTNGRCMGNNTCKCNDGYLFLENRCRPVCEPACVAPNAACQVPNMCQCRPRFKKFNATFCEPICSFTDEEFECINANCIGFNRCQCFDGYVPVSEFQCEPICANCTNGMCVAPGQCECIDGYEKNEDNVCAPVCFPQCINGFCQAPNDCTCYENYEMYLNNYECLEQRIIQSHQDCRRSCEHGSCIGNGTCICNYGYEMYHGKCSKICNKNCGHGKCLENQCVCPPQYRLENSTCVPICAFEDGHDCINGDCIAPNVCRCFESYRFLDDRNCTCVPMCNPSCINGICTEDGCICHEGFYNVPNYECGKNCSAGFVWIVDECFEEFSFDSETFDESEMFDESTIPSTTTDSTDDERLFSNEEDSREFDEVTESLLITTTSKRLDYDEEIDEGGLDENDDDDDGIFKVEIIDDPIKNEETMTKEERKKLFYITFIVVLSVIFVLLIAILIAFYVLYQFIFPKHIYFVQQKEESSNSVYYTKHDKNGQLAVTEFNI